MIEEDPAALRARFMKKEKFIKDVIFSDSRQGYQFFSSVKKDFEKEKNVISVKLYFLYKLGQIFAAGRGGAGMEDLLQMAAFLQATVLSQIALLDSLREANREERMQASDGTTNIKAAIQEYIQAKALMKKKIEDFILKHRAGIIKTRAEADVAYMKKSGQIPATAGEEELAALRRQKEAELLSDIVYPEVAKRTERLEAIVNRLVAFRSRVASAPPGSLNASTVAAEQKSLLDDFVQAVAEIKANALEGAAAQGIGIFRAPPALEILDGFRSNLNEQRLRSGHIFQFLTELKAAGGVSGPMHDIEGSSVAQAACDKIEELMRDERNVYVDVRKWEPAPGRFFDEMSGAVKFPEANS